MIMTGHSETLGYTKWELLSFIEEINNSLKAYESRVANYGVIGYLMNYFDLNVAALKGRRVYYEGLLIQE